MLESQQQPAVYLPPCFQAVDPSYLLMLLSNCSCMPSVTIEEKVVTTNREKGQLQRLKQDLGRKYDGLSLKRSS